VPAGVGLTGLTQHGHVVSVTLAEGSAADYDLVVGADGINSAVRRLAVSPAPPQYADTVSWRSIIPVRPLGADHLMIFTGERRYFGLVPVGDCSTYVFAGLDTERFDDPPAGRLERLRQRFANFGGPVPACLTALQCDEQIHFGPIEWVELPRWHTGRVVLIGDAAHATPPHLGEGGAMAIEDAVVMAELLHDADTVEDALTGTRRGVGHGSTGSSNRAGSPPKPGSSLPRSATPRYANAETRCSETATGHSSRTPNHVCY
jgi:FAD-dependent urate hydroxylase